MGRIINGEQHRAVVKWSETQVILQVGVWCSCEVS